jgi:hypothetical protein
MTINREDGRYALDCWDTPDPGDAEAAALFFSDESLELVIEANRLIASREFLLIELSEKRPPGEFDGWYRITRFSVPEQVGEGPE